RRESHRCHRLAGRSLKNSVPAAAKKPILTIPQGSRYKPTMTIKPTTIKKSNPDFLNGVPELLILKLLGQRPMHGYDLVEAIKTSSLMQLEFGEGCVYPLLHRLE